MKFIVSDIKYDTDDVVIDLPTEIEVDVPNYITDKYDEDELISDDISNEIDEYISDEISNIMGFCLLGFLLKKKN